MWVKDEENILSVSVESHTAVPDPLAPTTTVKVMIREKNKRSGKYLRSIFYL